MDGVSRKDILVLGVGNILLKDEGIGVHVIREMKKISQLPEGVRLVEGGTHGVNLLGPICEASRLILVDAIEADSEPPGTIFKFKPGDIDCATDGIRFSVEEIGPLEVLDMAQLCGSCPDTVIFGIQPKEIKWGLEPTPEVSSKIPQIIELILEEVRNLGKE